MGNPPFLGGKKMRSELGDDYMDHLFDLWRERVRPEADLCCYWFEKARRQIEQGKCQRAGLLATQGIRGGANRDVLKRIKETGDIFFAESDRPWILEGANVHVSMVGFGANRTKENILDGKAVAEIHANLTASLDLSAVVPLVSNAGIAFQGPVRVGPFDISLAEALSLLHEPNPTGAPNSDVIRPSLNGGDVVKKSRERWAIDFGSLPVEVACQYEGPFGVVKEKVKPIRDANREKSRKERWWLHGRTGDDFRYAVATLARYLAMAQTAKYFVWRWYPSLVSPEQTLIVFGREDDYIFGVLHSRLHGVWGLKLGTRLETRPRYTPTTCFETFPFPEANDSEMAAIAGAAKELDALRTSWLDPPEWTKQEVLEFPGSVNGPWARYVHDPDGRGIGTVRFPRTVPKDEECAKKLAKRTLTNLYNERPTWLDLAHERLDAAVFAAYGWKPTMSDAEVLAGLLTLNLERAEKQ